MKRYIFYALFSFIFGFIFFAYQQNWIILKIPNVTQINNIQEKQLIKKNIKIYFWKNNRWNFDFNEILISDAIEENLFKITNVWLSQLDEEKLTESKISLQSAMISKNEQEAYLSFDKNLFNDESSTFNKLILIESLLKTLKDNDINIQKIYFLVHHKPLEDYHLDFSHGWPTTGFI